MKENIIFDLYGTLIDIKTDEFSLDFWEDFALSTKNFKKYTPLELKDSYFKTVIELEKDKDEINITDVFNKLFPGLDEHVIDTIAWSFRKMSYIKIKLYKKVDLLLSLLKSEGYKVYLLSNAQEAFTMPELIMFNLNQYFDDIFISSAHGLKKPNIEFYNKLIKKHKLDPSKTVMIGNDYNNDILPAKSLGMDTIYLETKTSPKQRKVEKIKGFNWKKIYNKIRSM